MNAPSAGSARIAITTGSQTRLSMTARYSCSRRRRVAILQRDDRLRQGWQHLRFLVHGSYSEHRRPALALDPILPQRRIGGPANRETRRARSCSAVRPAPVTERRVLASDRRDSRTGGHAPREDWHGSSYLVGPLFDVLALRGSGQLNRICGFRLVPSHGRSAHKLTGNSMPQRLRDSHHRVDLLEAFAVTASQDERVAKGGQETRMYDRVGPVVRERQGTSRVVYRRLEFALHLRQRHVGGGNDHRLSDTWVARCF